MQGTSGHVVTLYMFVYKYSPVQLKYLFETMLFLFFVNKNNLNLSDDKIIALFYLEKPESQRYVKFPSVVG